MERSKLSQSLYGVIAAVVSYASLGALPEQKTNTPCGAVLMPRTRAQGALRVGNAPRVRSKEIFNELKSGFETQQPSRSDFMLLKIHFLT